jgi:DNA-binding IclR family transcriptional regulator
VIAAIGVSGPTARLQDRVDQVGRLLIEQSAELSALLRRRTRKEGAA